MLHFKLIIKIKTINHAANQNGLETNRIESNTRKSYFNFCQGLKKKKYTEYRSINSHLAKTQPSLIHYSCTD